MRWDLRRELGSFGHEPFQQRLEFRTQIQFRTFLTIGGDLLLTRIQ